jgi:hypothetical protein
MSTNRLQLPQLRQLAPASPLFITVLIPEKYTGELVFLVPQASHKGKVQLLIVIQVMVWVLGFGGVATNP